MKSVDKSLAVDGTVGAGSISLVFMNGVVVTGTKPLLIHWLKDKHTWTFFGIVSAAFLILSGFILPADIKPPKDWQIALFTCISLITFFVILIFVILKAFYISLFTPNLILPMTLVIFIVHVLNQIIAAGTNYYFWGIEETASSFLVWRLLGLYLVVVIFEAIFTAYILPKSCLSRNSSGFKPAMPRPVEQTGRDNQDREVAVFLEAKAKTAETPTTVTLGGRKFELASIKLIQAEDNYIRVLTTSDAVLVRAKMNDVMESLPKTAGVRAHRSFWVSFWHIESEKPLKNGQLLLKLTDDETLTVPRARKKIVLRARALFQETLYEASKR